MVYTPSGTVEVVVGLAALRLRVAMRWVRAKGEPSDKDLFLQEVGDKKVTSPLTGNPVRLKTLMGPKYQKDDSAQQILTKEYEAWSKSKPSTQEVPEPDMGDTPARPESQEAPKSEAPEPDMDKGAPTDVTPEGVANTFSLIWKGLGGAKLSPEEIENLQAQEQALRELAGEEEDKDKEQKSSLSIVSDAARELLHKHDLTEQHAEQIQAYVQDVHKQKEQAQTPLKEIHRKYDLDADEVKTIDKAIQSVRDEYVQAHKQYKREMVRYEEDRKKYLEKQTDWKVHSSQVQKQHRALQQQLKSVGVPDSEFEAIQHLAQQHKSKFQEQMKQWTTLPPAKQKYTDKPTMPDIQIEWLKQHRQNWKSEEPYQSPAVSKDLFQQILDAPKMPAKPKAPPKPKEPQPPSGKDIRKNLNPNAAKMVQKLSDEEFQTLTKSPDAKSNGELKLEFLDSVSDPDLRARVSAMDPDEFAEFIQVFGGQGKMGSLALHTIRMAYMQPEIRGLLLLAGGWK